MKDLTGKHFGLLIAYVLPGFVALWGLRSVSPTVAQWLEPTPTLPAGLESLFFVLLASITVGMTVSAVRWAILDTLHHHTGLPRPQWDDSLLPTHLDAFDAVVEWHYRHYQFYGNTAVSLALLFLDQFVIRPYPHPGVVMAFIGVELLFVATSRDTLRKYYARTTRLLGTIPRATRSMKMANGSHPPKSSPPQNPQEEAKKTSKPSK